jgi:hypothetical protein
VVSFFFYFFSREKLVPFLQCVNTPTKNKSPMKIAKGAKTGPPP